MKTSYLEINQKEIKENLQKIKRKIGNKKVMPVIKADGYGTGAEAILPVLKKEEIEQIAVATVDEAIILRNVGWDNEILILNQIWSKDEEAIEGILSKDLTIGISELKTLEILNHKAKEKNKKVKIHVELDTGMGRCGLTQEKVLPFFEEAKKMEQIEIEGIYTHFSSADDEDRTYTNNQISLFEKKIQELKEKGFEFKYIHAQASGGILGYDIPICNMVRPGIILYGYAPAEFLKKELDLKPVARLVSHVIFLKEVPEGTSISYSRTYVTKEKRKIATIPLGYADGIKRILSNRGTVKIHKKDVPIVGNICMDNFMVDVTEIEDIQIGDEVIIWEGYELEKIANLCHTIPYEILCSISKRVPRIYRSE